MSDNNPQQYPHKEKSIFKYVYKLKYLFSKQRINSEKELPVQARLTLKWVDFEKSWFGDSPKKDSSSEEHEQLCKI